MHLATIGSGSIVDTFLDAVSHTEGVFPEAVYSRTEERARKFAERHGIGKSYWDLGDMLADPMVDTVYIASPNSLHFSYAKQALEAGKHVICEKPFVSTKKRRWEYPISALNADISCSSSASQKSQRPSRIPNVHAHRECQDEGCSQRR